MFFLQWTRCSDNDIWITCHVQYLVEDQLMRGLSLHFLRHRRQSEAGQGLARVPAVEDQKAFKANGHISGHSCTLDLPDMTQDW